MKKDLKAYYTNKLNILIHDHNHYNNAKDNEATKDYRRAIEDLKYCANKQGIEIKYAVDANGYLKI